MRHGRSTNILRLNLRVRPTPLAGELTMQLTVNGREHTVDADPTMPILWALRDMLGMSGTKFGCGAALCGACTVHLDSKAILSSILSGPFPQGSFS